jgi:outer membrane protein OmpA-like peptidoglycan-associated protein
VKTYFFIVITAFSIVASSQAHAQRKKNKFKSGGLVELNDSLTHYGQSDIFAFPNVNKLPFFSDEKIETRMERLEKSLALQEFYNTLRAYVSNFGPENFSANTPLIWKLARLSEKYGPPGESVLLYKLVLKHYRKNTDIAKVRQEFDSITVDQKDHYVPLKQYYELVAFRKEIDTLRPPQGVLMKMGEWVNSQKADYGPTIGNLDFLLLFTSKRNSGMGIERTYNEDLFFTRKEDGQWMEAEEFKTINTRYNEGSACLSKDGKNLYFARCNSPDSFGNCDIFSATLNADSVWANVRNLGKNINTLSWDSHPSLSHSGDTLYFASDRLGGFGLSDVYYSVKGKDGNWQKAQNVGPIINTRGNEVSPFYHRRHNVLYFSSDGQPLTFGDFDIYKSYRLEVNWDEPKNIGPLVNGPGSEYYFTIDSESSQLFYARSDESEIENLDLHTFPVPMEAQPTAVARLKGSLINAQTKKPFKGIVSVIDMDKGVEVAPKFLRSDGSFDFDLINKRNYLLIIQGEDFFRIEELFFMDGDTEMHRETDPIESKIAFASLEFEHGKADILPSMHGDLTKLANFLIDHPDFSLNISGHTDSQGSEVSNLLLSQARADAIKAYLIYEFKISTDRITATGYGSSQPLVSERNDEDRKLNRRVEFKIERD